MAMPCCRSASVPQRHRVLALQILSAGPDVVENRTFEDAVLSG
jgi:hypothetical protein